jgi:uncharacterized protein (DUF433 family)
LNDNARGPLNHGYGRVRCGDRIVSRLHQTVDQYDSRGREAEASAMKHERVESSQRIMGGKPVIRGTRIPVELILRKFRAGMAPEAIIADHPRLTQEDVLAAQSFAAS